MFCQTNNIIDLSTPIATMDELGVLLPVILIVFLLVGIAAWVIFNGNCNCYNEEYVDPQSTCSYDCGVFDDCGCWKAFASLVET